MANWGTLREPRQAIVLHYDASASDKGAVEWLLKDPRCRVSYSWLILDDGSQLTVAPANSRAWHAGICRPSNASFTYRDLNSAGYGIAVAARDGETATGAQKMAVLRLCYALFQHHGWSLKDDLWRLTGHDSECWPRGRKHDPTGSDPNRPVLSVSELRDLLRKE